MAVTFGSVSGNSFVNSNVSLSEAVTITNMLGDAGSAENTGWNLTSADMQYSTTHAKYSTTSLRLHGRTNSPETTCATSASFTPIADHIYYARWEGYQETQSGVTAQIYWPVVEPSFGSINLGPAGQWNMYSWRADRNATGLANGNFRIDYDNNKQEGYIWADGMMLVDLTADFGAGNEPDKEWCDENIMFTTSSVAVPSYITVG